MVVIGGLYGILRIRGAQGKDCVAAAHPAQRLVSYGMAYPGLA